MKTAQQIKQYLEKQEWFPRFLKNLENPIAKRESSLNGILGEQTIFYAFNWEKTGEGYLFWKSVNERFENWFNNDNLSNDNESESSIDWEYRRYEVAKEIYLHQLRSILFSADIDAANAVKWADILIDKLKKERG